MQPDYVESECTEATHSSTKPEDLQKCISAGILPKCYEGTAIEVEVKEQTERNCLSLNEDGTATCPMGCILKKIRTRGRNSVYASKEARRQCQNRCISSENHKTLSFGSETNCVPVRMYGKAGQKLNRIPEGARISPYNHTLGRKDYASRNRSSSGSRVRRRKSMSECACRSIPSGR